jgi:hypothetical protein
LFTDGNAYIGQRFGIGKDLVYILSAKNFH